MLKGRRLSGIGLFSKLSLSLGGMKSFYCLSKMDVAFSFSEPEDLEAASRTLLELIFWMD